jgi:isoquinoline 1-oxidoreductase beta subunit
MPDAARDRIGADAVDAPSRGNAAGAPGGVSRRRFVGYLVAAPTVMAGAQLLAEPAAAAIPTIQPVDHYDLTDALTGAAAPTSGLVTVTVNKDGTVSFALPRAEVGQGITTAVAMAIADEMDVALDKVEITLADARPELVWNQFTAGSNTMHSIYTPVRVAAAIARGQLLQAASELLNEAPQSMTVRGGVITASGGRSVTFGELAERGAVSSTTRAGAQLKAASQQRIVGTARRRVDALDIVTGRKRFAMDLDVPGALPTMVCRPPTINGRVRAVRNLAAGSGSRGWSPDAG